jgi:GNAT superfamily N-acetyltransferase
VFELINQAYEVEIGDTGVAFQKKPRLTHPFDTGMDDSFKKGQILLAKEQGALIGCIVWGLSNSTQGGEIDVVRFGPFAVSPRAQGKGVGGKLMS